MFLTPCSAWDVLLVREEAGMGKHGRGDIKEAAPEGMLARGINTGGPVGDEVSSPRSSFSPSYPNAHCHADSPTRGHARAQRSGTGLLATSPPANADPGKGIAPFARSSPRDRMTIEFLSSASSRSPWYDPPPATLVKPGICRAPGILRPLTHARPPCIHACNTILAGSFS